MKDQTRKRGRARGIRVWAAAGAAVLIGLLGGCASPPKDVLPSPRTLVAPYSQTGGEVVWAVVPLRNESGVQSMEMVRFEDLLTQAAEQVRGIRTVPVNRTLRAMSALEMDGVKSGADARRLAEAMKVDAVLLGSVTAYDPYTPAVGLSLALYARPGGMMPQGVGQTDVRALTASTSEQEPRGGGGNAGDRPLSLASMHLDGTNNQVRLDAKAYGEGRQDGPAAMGWRKYVKSMPHFCEFAAYHAVDELLRNEWIRLGRERVTPAATERADAKGGDFSGSR